MLSNTAAFLLLMPQIFAQAPAATAPADVDLALRTRITKFYQTQVDGKPRLAEPLVAEESKDVFYAMVKPRFLSFSIDRIDYSENFTQAKATIVVKMYLPIAQLSTEPMNLPVPSLWKIENGEWCWYIDPDVMKTTPMGKATPATGETSTPSAVSAPPDLKRGPTVEELWQKVKADKAFVVLRVAQDSEDQVSILNQMPGPVKINVHFPPVPGMEVVTDRLEIPANEKATIHFHLKTGAGKIPARSVLGHVMVEPIHSMISVRVVFQ